MKVILALILNIADFCVPFSFIDSLHLMKSNGDVPLLNIEKLNMMEITSGNVFLVHLRGRFLLHIFQRLHWIMRGWGMWAILDLTLKCINEFRLK